MTHPLPHHIKKILEKFECHISFPRHLPEQEASLVSVAGEITSTDFKSALKKRALIWIDAGTEAVSVWDPNRHQYVTFWFTTNFCPRMDRQTLCLFLNKVGHFLPREFYPWQGLFHDSNFNFENFNHESYASWNLKKSSIDGKEVTPLNVSGANINWIAENYPYFFVDYAKNLCISGDQNKIIPDYVLRAQELIDVDKIPAELLRDAMIQSLKLPKPSLFFRRLNDLGLLEKLMPELHSNIGCKQNPRWHEEDVFDHLMRCVDMAEQHVPAGSNKALFKLAVMLHDVGKAATRKEVSSA